MEAKKTIIPNHPVLLEIYENATLDKQKHFREQWIVFNGLKRGQFYERVKNPKVIDYMLWQIVCDDLIFTDRVIGIFEAAYKNELEKVEVYTIPKPKFFETPFPTII